MDKNKIYIGDNLKIMTSEKFKKYYDKIDFIYIDPPYNTYNGSFAFSDKNEKWNDDLKKRLEISKKLLSDYGCIFISIDDNELHSLIKICFDIFGKKIFKWYWCIRLTQSISLSRLTLDCFGKKYNNKYRQISSVNKL